MLRIDQTVPTAFAELHTYSGHCFFTFDEMKCKCNGRFCDPLKSDWWQEPEFKEFMKLATLIRREVRFPWHVNSGHRCPRYNDSLYKGDGTKVTGPHTKGAMDISVNYERAYIINKMASDFDMGLGICQHGTPARRYFHLDNQGPRIWTYNAH